MGAAGGAIQHVTAGPVGSPMVMVTLRHHDHPAWGNRNGVTTGSVAGVAIQETVVCVEHSRAAAGMEPSRSTVEPSRGGVELSRSGVEPSRSGVEPLRSSSRSGVEH